MTIHPLAWAFAAALLMWAGWTAASAVNDAQDARILTRNYR